MSFRDRLARLPALPGSPAAPSPEAPAPGRADGRRLDELREKIAAILARSGPAAAPVAPPPPRLPRGTRFRDLPFEPRERGEGPLHERVLELPSSARVGRIELDAALLADPAVLSLLALDPELAGRSIDGALYLDTETTGLGTSGGVVPFLVGVVRREGSAFRLVQWMLFDPGDEAPMLEELRGYLEAASFLVSYNGKSFDLPLLRSRYVMNRLAPPPERPHLDLLHVARRVHKTTCASCSLSAVEAHALGLVRIGDISGRDILSAYTHFLRTGDEETLGQVVEHNDQDVRSLVALLGLYAEPLESDTPPSLPPEDLASMALTVRRAGALDVAHALAERSVGLGGGAHALRARAEIALGRGDRARALLDFEALASQAPDEGIRLRLAKLYEHHVRAYEDALRLVAEGTGEAADASERRAARLRRKLGR